jgi:hypothetical protein
MDPDAVPFLKLKRGRPRKQRPPENFLKPERQTRSLGRMANGNGVYEKWLSFQICR